MLLAIRRYRLFLLVAVLFVTSVYYLSSDREPQYPQPNDLGHKTPAYTDGKPDNPPNGDQQVPARPDAHRPIDYVPPAYADVKDKSRPPSAVEEEKVVSPDVVDATLPKKPKLDLSENEAKHGANEGKEKSKEEEEEDDVDSEESPTDDDRKTGSSQSLLETPDVPTRKGGEQFPVAEKELIRLPTGSEQALPKIQFSFSPESAAEKEDRTKKQALIRKSFEHAWQGYKKHAMGYDELKPLTKIGVNQTQFMGWGATLVDTLDTLWIMGLEEEFDNAVKEVAKIDFKTSTSTKIPLFETVIRYLGGLLSAHELTSGKHQILLDKAVELADVLMGAFDTPNRMPVPFYHWKSHDTSQPLLSDKNTVLAELGTLSMEFTKLAQLTKENKYYDAVARITNALDKFQAETKMPGLWPLRVDSSGCKPSSKSDPSPTRPDPVAAPVKEHIKDPYDHDDLHNVPETKPEPPKEFKDPYAHDEPPKLPEKKLKSESQGDKPPTFQPKQQARESSSHKRDAAEYSQQIQKDQSIIPGCEPQGLRQAPFGTVSFGIGGLADSAYEYLPKMYALLGGQNKQYLTMYNYAIKAIKDNLLFRPMIKDEERSILFASRIEYDMFEKDLEKQKKTNWEATHLGCFAGGMVGLASRLFDNHKDMEIAKKLTDGCIWAYESTESGVMPESFNIAPCGSQNSCPWSEKRWHELLELGMQGKFDGVTVWNKEKEEVYGEDTRGGADGKVRAADGRKPVRPEATVVKGGIKSEDIENEDIEKEGDEEESVKKVDVKKEGFRKEDTKKTDSGRKLMKRADSDDSAAKYKSNAKITDQDSGNSRPKILESKKDSAKGPAPPQEDSEKDNDEITQDRFTPAEDANGVKKSDKSKDDGKGDKPDDVETAESKVDDDDDDDVDDIEDESVDDSGKTEKADGSDSRETGKGEKSSQTSSQTKVQTSSASSTKSTSNSKLSHEDYVLAKIEEDRLPPGYISIFDREYQLRPEAIESVFIMWRLTGEKYWREKGWTMFQSIERITTTDVGNAAVTDVTSILPANRDSMESFWLAETLKYFYLLFSEPDLIDLDEYVFNTEAHPFKIPKAKDRK